MDPARLILESELLTLYVPRVYSELGKSAFFFDAPHSWATNSLSLSPTEFKNLITDQCSSYQNCIIDSFAFVIDLCR